MKISYSQLSEGNMSFLFGVKEEVLENRKQFLEKNGINIERTVCMQVKHSDEVMIADERLAGVSMNDKESAMLCDGLITDQKNLFLFLLIADCIPVGFYDPKKEVVGIAHCGWKELDLGIIESMIEKFTSIYQSDPKDIQSSIGPSIRKDSYIKENPSQKDDHKWQRFIEVIENNNYKVDIVGFCKDRLIRSGVKLENIIDSRIDTATDKRYFSHYRDKKDRTSDQGRFACVIGLR